MKYLILPVYVMDQENAVMQDDCFSSFNQNTNRDEVTVIVIDNGSLYGVDEAQSFADIYVRTPCPVGYAKAVNMGWKITETYTDCEYVGVLNNDLIFLPNWLQPLIDNLDSKTAACASYDQPMPIEAVTDHIWSSCFLMKDSIRKEIGYFDDVNLPYRYHDQDYWMRAKSLGYSFKRIGASQVKHKESSTYKKMVEKNTEVNEERIVRERWGVAMAQYYNKPA